MKRFSLFVILILMFAVLGCGSGPTPNPEPTATLVKPSDTPEPTDTPMPTDTPTPVPTSTPDAAATAAGLATEAASVVLDELDTLLGGSEVPYQGGHLIWQQTEPLAIEMQGPSGDDSILEIDDQLTARNFVFKSDVTWEATGWMYCGAIVRSEENLKLGAQYQFYFLRFSGLPAWYIDYYDQGDYINSISGEQFSQAIDMGNGAINQFVLVAEDEKFTVYFNGDRQGRFFDDSQRRADGIFGFMAWQESGTGSCKFENSWIWSLD